MPAEEAVCCHVQCPLELINWRASGGMRAAEAEREREAGRRVEKDQIYDYGVSSHRSSSCVLPHFTCRPPAGLLWRLSHLEDDDRLLQQP